MLNLHIPIDDEHRPCLDEQGLECGGSEPRNRALPGKEFAMPTGRIAMDVVDEVLRMRHGCGRTLTEALSKRHPYGTSVASPRLFTINRNGVHARRNTHPLMHFAMRSAAAIIG